MPDALSRRSDYHTGKGTTFGADQHPTQALPNFDEYRGGLHETLNALQDSSLRNDEEYYINPHGLVSAQRNDTNLTQLREDMMSIKCYLCKHPACNSAPTFDTLDDLRRNTRNPEFVNPRWTVSGLISFGHWLYVSNFDNSRLKVLQSRHDSTLAGHPGVAKTTELVL